MHARQRRQVYAVCAKFACVAGHKVMDRIGFHSYEIKENMTHLAGEP